MGRPRKNPEGVVDKDDAELPMTPELKACPACGGKAEVWKDRNKHYRCSCTACGFWDSVPHLEPFAAADSWNMAGGPNPVE